MSGTLYGITCLGGTTNNGVVFDLNLASGAEQVLYSFTPLSGSPNAGLTPANGELYGTSEFGNDNGLVFALSFSGTFSTVYEFDPYLNLNLGALPQTGLVLVGNTLYGTTSVNPPTVFGLDLSSGDVRTLYNFKRFPLYENGGLVPGNLIAVGNVLYGTTSGGGTEGGGAVYSVNIATGQERTIYSFGGGSHPSDALNPNSGIAYMHGTLYGTSQNGGTVCKGNSGDGCGTVWAVNIKSGKEKVLHSFPRFSGGTDGSIPWGDWLR